MLVAKKQIIVLLLDLFKSEPQCVHVQCDKKTNKKGWSPFKLYMMYIHTSLLIMFKKQSSYYVSYLLKYILFIYSDRMSCFCAMFRGLVM